MQKSHHSHRISRPERGEPIHTERNRFHPPLAGNQHELERDKTRTEWHRILCWTKLADWAGTQQKGAYVKIEGELRYRDYTPAEADRSVRVAEIHANSILALDRSDRQPVFIPESEPADESLD